jgi:soluble lytic murein transglycosylase
MIRVFLVFLLTLPLFAEINITKEWLEEKPRSSYKDFYLWRYLNKDISPEEAIWALGETKNVNNKLFYRYAKKLNHTETSRVVTCMKMSHTKIIKEDSNCIELGLTPYKATKLSSKELQNVIKKIENDFPKTAQIFSIIKNPMPFQDLINSEAEIFYGTFLEVGGVYRRTHFNHHLHIKTLQKIKSDTKNFQRFIRKVVLSPKLNKLQESLFQVDPKGLDHKSQFYLAVNAIKHKKYNLALKYLEESSKTAYFKFDKDKVNFWKYKLTNNKQILNELAKSWDINIYSLYAKEHTGEKITNSVFEFPNTTSDSKYNIDNPFLWLKVLRESKKMDEKKMKSFENLFNSKLLSGHLAFVQERFHNYKKSFYPSPYDEYISKYSKQRQALINSIARQESRFIPTSISHSYAMGVMQIMPFLSKALAKEMDEEYDIDKQLDAATNLRYAHKHLNWLEKRLSHPLFIAYAYNGGIGFTNRMLKSGIFKKGKYEPYLSIELVPYDESKRYGKKVLANYVMYYNHTHKAKISITSLLQNLTKPHQ